MSELSTQIALYQVYKSLIHVPANTGRCISNLLIHLQIGKLIITQWNPSYGHRTYGHLLLPGSNIIIIKILRGVFALVCSLITRS